MTSLPAWGGEFEGRDDGARIQRAIRSILTAADGAALSPSDRYQLAAWAADQPDPEQALGRVLLWLGAQREGSTRRPQAWAGPGGAPWVDRSVIPVEQTGSADVDTPPVRPADWVPKGLCSTGSAVEVIPVVDPPGLPLRNRKVARRALWVRNAGVIILLFLAYQLWGTKFEQSRAQAQLGAGFAKLTAAQQPPPQPPAGDNPSVAMPVAAPARGAPLPGGVVGRIEIPSIHIDQFVVEGTNTADLKKGPGHYVGTAVPGQPGNAAIAGHRTTYGAPFNRLGDLKPGDSIITTDLTGARYLYVVAAKQDVSPSQISVVEDYGDNRLTLTTCTPEFLATQRMVIIAALAGPAPQTPPATNAPPGPLAAQPISGGPGQAAIANAARQVNDGWSLHNFPKVFFVGALLVGLGLLYRPMRWRLPPLAAMAVLTPLWLCGLLVLFEQLNHFLPPNV